jgi:hypothetical protein
VFSCWICGDHIEIMSKEHQVKASDLKQAFPRQITQKNPLYLHRYDGLNNIPVASISKNKNLRSSAPMCCKCNNERTQIHDKSWSTLHKYLISDFISKPTKIKLEDVFRNSSCSIKGVQLFFAKNLGCRIIDNSVPFDVSPLSDAIINNKVCGSLFLSIGFTGSKNKFSGRTHLTHGNSGIIHYIYGAGDIYVRVIYSTEEPTAIPVSFSPIRSSKYLELIDWK